MQTTNDKSTARLMSVAMLMLCLAATLAGQSFPSGSTGADGPLNITTAGVTTLTTPPVGGGSVYNFTTINIALGSTLKLSGAVFPEPIYFLASGAVTIAGTIDLSGQAGSVPATSAQRVPTIPGSGGYGGGSGPFGAIAAMPGIGPAGGAANLNVGSGCGNVAYGANGGFTGNQFLVPLVGGFGGGGYSGGSGGAGGGAILIASSVSITVTGTITANGGNGSSNAGGGAGGGIRLVAPTVAGTGTITAAGAGFTFNCNQFGIHIAPSNGVVRLESFQSTFTGSTGGNVYTATPVGLFVPAASAQPTLMVTSIGGVAVPASPTGSFTVPDVALSSGSPLTVNISASNIPLGTIPTVNFSTENFPDQAIAANTGLAGTLAASTTTATVTLNPGYSIGYVTATWTH